MVEMATDGPSHVVHDSSTGFVTDCVIFFPRLDDCRGSHPARRTHQSPHAPDLAL
jgi:hypothetical protein